MLCGCASLERSRSGIGRRLRCLIYASVHEWDFGGFSLFRLATTSVVVTLLSECPSTASRNSMSRYDVCNGHVARGIGQTFSSNTPCMQHSDNKGEENSYGCWDKTMNADCIDVQIINLLK